VHYVSDVTVEPRERDTASQRGTGTWRLLVAMALASGITSVPNAAIVLALPTLHREFDASTTMLQWTVTGYLLAYSSLLIAAGRLADLLGRKRVLMAGTVLFVGASAVGALAQGAIMLILALIVTGVGAAILTPASLAIVTDAFRGERRGMAVGAWGAATALFSGIGPAIGGVFTGELSWRWILWLNVIVGAAILVGAREARESRNEDGGTSFDVLGLVCSFGALAGITLALNETPAEWKWGSVQTIATLAIAVVLLLAFVIAEPRVRAPLVDLGMFARRNLAGASISLLVLNFALGAVLFFLPVYLQELLGYSPLDTGLLLLPSSIGMGVAMPIGGKLYERLGPVWPIVGGMALSALAMLLLGGIGPGTTYAGLWLPLTLLGFGIGAALTPLNLVALGAVPQRQHAAVGGIITTVAGLGATFGVAVSGALFEGLQIDDTVDDARRGGIDLSDSAASTLDGLLAGTPSATQLLDRYSAAEQDTLRNAVHDGFLSALGTTMTLSLAIVAVGIVLTFVLIRRPGRGVTAAAAAQRGSAPCIT
jgi:EmrB/QacA subfamily drug resistance transporter